MAIIGVDPIRELLAGLLSLVVVALALQQLHNLVFADVHELPFPQTGESETPGSVLTSANAFLAFSPQCGSTLPSTAGFLDLLVAGRFADFHVPRWQSAPTVLDTD